MTRILDIILSVIGLLFLSPFLLAVALCCYFDTRHPVFKQQRLGKNCCAFTLIKFRTMFVDTKNIGTHLVQKSEITALGAILRKYKIDELLQLWNVLMGEMSIVGPRPCLKSQKEVIKERKCLDVFRVLPGITGLSQLEGIDMSTPKKLAVCDAKMIENMSVSKYFFFIFKTLVSLWK